MHFSAFLHLRFTLSQSDSTLMMFALTCSSDWRKAWGRIQTSRALFQYLLVGTFPKRFECYWCVVLTRHWVINDLRICQPSRAAAGRGQRWLTCQYPGRNSRTVWLFWDGPAACVSGTPCMHAWKEINVNVACISEEEFCFLYIRSWECVCVCVCVYMCMCTCIWDLLVVVLLFLLSPVLVELVDFNSCVALLKQVKSLCDKMNAHTFVLYSYVLYRESGWGRKTTQMLPYRPRWSRPCPASAAAGTSHSE